jgi:hypothetical protein
MALTMEEKKAKREEGRLKELLEMTTGEKIRRALTNGRPPASEFKTPLGAFTAAATLYSEIQRQWPANYDKPNPGDIGVAAAFVTTDLSLTGITPLYAPGAGLDAFTKHLDGKIILGLVFGIKDPDETDVTLLFALGVRPFISMKQVDQWLSGLTHVLPILMGDEELEWKMQQQEQK